MARRYIYIGCFFDPADLTARLRPIREHSLKKSVREPHVTFAFKPAWVDESLFGLPVRALVVGYGSDGMNEGVRVLLSADDGRLRDMIEEITLPHITLSFTPPAEPVDTQRLSFRPVPPVLLTGRFGGYTDDGRVLLAPV